jgi:hypothetical protein
MPLQIKAEKSDDIFLDLIASGKSVSLSLI